MVIGIIMNVSEQWDLAVRELSNSDSKLGLIISNYKRERIKLKKDGFFTLARAIIGQQISVKAAETIWKRLEKKCKDNVHPKKILECSKEELGKIGLSKQKINYLQNIAQSKVLDTKWENLSDEMAIDLLCGIKGVGVWTAEMFLIFHLARPNILPVGDVGLKKAIEINYNKGQKIGKEMLEELKRRWKPWCSVATWYLWRSLDPKPIEY
jgi:DNA-3-methyladenine glycosylase II